MSTSYHPQSRVKAERANRTINSVLRHLVDERKNDWASQIGFVQFAMNASKADSTGYSTFELTEGYIPNTLASVLLPPITLRSKPSER